MVRAIGLVSGGLDSVLAARLLMDQGIEVLCMCFISAFFDDKKAKIAAKMLGVPLRSVDFIDIHMDMVKAPVSGYGKNMNPCIDCHALMLETAGKIMEKEGYDFLFTGEVLGQRPMSQNYGSLNRVAKLSKYRDKVLRPLSAKLLEITPMEESGLVDRERLESFNGRSRKPQFELAAKFGFVDYDPPGGGCMLTDPGYSDKLRNLLKVMPQATSFETDLLRLGRIFWPAKEVLAVGGRNHQGNIRLSKAARTSDLLFSVSPPVAGATILLTGKLTDSEENLDSSILNIGAQLAVRYSKAPMAGSTKVIITDGDGNKIRTIEAENLSENELEDLRTPQLS